MSRQSFTNIISLFGLQRVADHLQALQIICRSVVSLFCVCSVNIAKGIQA